MTVIEPAKKSKLTFQGKLLKCYRLNKEGSSKEILHVVLDLAASGINYTVGSSFAIYPHNSPEYVKELVDIIGVDIIGSLDWEPFFRTKVNLSQITPKLITLLHKHTNNKELAALLEDRAALKVYADENTLVTCLRTFWCPLIPLSELSLAVSPLLPRYYSVASSMKHVGNEVHFMVASFKYLEAGIMKQSVTSQYFQTLEENSTVTFFLQENSHFTVPKDPNTPMIMIGPGTGLAAFRGFIQERLATKAPGKNWLFTGDRERKYDFHYGEELLHFEKEGLLRLSTAFSRDGASKVYVQHKMLEAGAELWHWIAEQNAHIYISGDAKSMAKDVQSALLHIAIHHGHLTEEAAKTLLKDLRKTGRLTLDVY